MNHAASAPDDISGLLALARRELSDPREATLLVGHALGLPRVTLYAHPERAITPNEAGRALALVARRAAGEAVAYLTGTREFYGLALTVTPDVLIPRPETELLVNLALAHLNATYPGPLPSRERARVRGETSTKAQTAPASRPRIKSGALSSPPSERRSEDGDAPVIADMGTGSGAIALALAHARPNAGVIATDSSAAALAVATNNARRLSIENVTFTQTDWFAGLAPKRFDVIVSNPPYVAAGDPHLGEGDLRFEPRTALASGAHGLDTIRRLAAQARTYLKDNGVLILEHGADQQDTVCAMLAEHGYASIAAHRDLAGLPRAITASSPVDTHGL